MTPFSGAYLSAKGGCHRQVHAGKLECRITARSPSLASPLRRAPIHHHRLTKPHFPQSSYSSGPQPCRNSGPPYRQKLETSFNRTKARLSVGARCPKTPLSLVTSHQESRDLGNVNAKI